jgi:hypothetical protein
MTADDVDRRVARVEALVSLLADEFAQVGYAEMMHLKRNVERYPARFRELLAKMVHPHELNLVTCGRCRGRGRLVLSLKWSRKEIAR